MITRCRYDQHRSRHAVLALFAALYLTGCATTAFERIVSGPYTGTTREVYVGVFNGWSFIVQDELAVEAVVELTNETRGRTGMGEKILLANLTLFLYNRTERALDVRIAGLSAEVSEHGVNTQHLEVDRELTIPPLSIDRDSRVKVVSTPILVPFYETEITLAGTASIDSEIQLPVELSLPRLTKEKLSQAIEQYERPK